MEREGVSGREGEKEEGSVCVCVCVCVCEREREREREREIEILISTMFSCRYQRASKPFSSREEDL